MINSIQNEDIILTYFDCTVRQSDLKLLDEGNWINDSCITFYFEYLRNILQSKQCFTAIYLMDPQFAALLVYETEFDDIKSLISFINFQQIEWILIPLNNNQDIKKIAGGTHWSLMVFQVKEKEFFYFDSTNSFMQTADIIASKLMAVYENNSLLLKKQQKITQGLDIPLQTNQYDCGVYVLKFTELLINFFLNKQNFKYPPTQCKELASISPIDIKQLRLQIQKQIRQLSQEYLQKKIKQQKL